MRAKLQSATLALHDGTRMGSVVCRTHFLTKLAVVTLKLSRCIGKKDDNTINSTGNNTHEDTAKCQPNDESNTVRKEVRYQSQES